MKFFGVSDAMIGLLERVRHLATRHGRAAHRKISAPPAPLWCRILLCGAQNGLTMRREEHNNA
jgi:hypothetical protein